MIHTRSTYWRSLALSPEERAQYIATGEMSIVPPAPRSHQVIVQEAAKISAAVAEYRAQEVHRRGDIARLARKHGVKLNSLARRVKIEEAAEIERQRTAPLKREIMLVCEMPGAGPKNSEISGPKRRVG